MNSEHINRMIDQNLTAGAPLDFADLMARIEADGGKSTADQLKKKASPVRRFAGIAAGIVLVAALSLTAVVTLGGGMAMSEAECAPEAAYDAEMEYVCDSSAVAEETMEESTVENEAMEPAAPESAEPGVVSDGDVSDSDVSEEEAEEDN